MIIIDSMVFVDVDEELPYGWAGEFCNKRTESGARFLEIRDWIYMNIDNYENNIQWVDRAYSIHMYFRKEKDLVWFKLRWSGSI